MHTETATAPADASAPPAVRPGAGTTSTPSRAGGRGPRVPGPSPAEPSPERLTVRGWWDPELALHGVDPRDDYVERFWLGLLGPST